MVTLAGLQVYTEHAVLQTAAVVVHNGKIQAITEQVDQPDFRFPPGYHLVPGFIDIHIHGAHGSDVMDGHTEAFATMAAALAAEGTTSFLATTMTADVDHISHVLVNIKNFLTTPAAQQGAQLLGVHLEGPFLSPERVGAQTADKLLAPHKQWIERWQQESGQLIKLVTLAPELPGSLEFIRFLVTQKIVASMGHTNATYADCLTAIRAGCSHVTHLFNAMRGLHQREPGVVTAALLSDVCTEMILDGVHLHPAIVQLVLKIKAREKIILVTDAMRAKCLPDGVYELGGQTVTVKQHVARLADGTLAGSTLKMCTALKNLLDFTGCSLHDAIQFVTLNPAKLLNIADRKGSIAIGKDADLVVLDENYRVVLTLRQGEIVYNNADP